MGLISSSVRKNWHLVYYLLAFFDLMAICAGVYISHNNLKEYSEVVQSDLDTVMILESAGQLLHLAQRANAPGNDVFESKDPVKEKIRYNQENALFDKHLVEHYGLLLGSVKSKEEREKIINQIANIHKAMSNMREVAIDIFTYFQNNDEGKAGALMAEMDRRYGALLRSIEELRNSISRSQLELIKKHQYTLKTSHRKEFIYLCLVFLSVLGVAFYGRKMSSFIREANLKDAHLASIVSSSEDAIIGKTIEGIINSWNQGAEKMFGYTAVEAIGKPIAMLIPDALKHEEVETLQKIKLGESVNHTNSQLITKSGDILRVSFITTPLKNQHGKVVGASKIIRDISAIIKANEDVNHILNNSNDLICIAHVDGTFKKVGPSFFKILGYEEQELLSRPFLDFIHPDDLLATQKIVQSLSQGIPLVDFENRYRAKNGEYKLISWNCTPDPLTGFLYAIGRDVTLLRQKEYHHNQVLSAIDQSGLVAFFDVQGRIIKVNDNLCQLGGHLKEELIGENYLRLISNNYSQRYLNKIISAVNSGQRWTGDFENFKKNGESYFVHCLLTPIKYMDNKIEHFMFIGFEVTEQKQAEKQLIEAQEIAKIGSWKYNLQTGHQWWSSEHYRIFEITEPQSQAELHRLYKERIHPDDQAKLNEVIVKASESGLDFIFDHRVYLDQGTRIKHVRGIGKVTKDSEGRPIYISGTCQDMTDFIALQEQNRFILEAMGIGIWKFNPQTKALSWDDSLYKLYGLEAKDFSGDYEAWESSLSPETKEKAVEELDLALSGKKDFNTSFEIITRDGSRKVIGGRGIVLRNDQSIPIMMYGINWDKTLEAKNQETLKAALDLNEAIHRSAKFSIITTTLDGTITGFNEEAERILGYDASEMIGKLTPAVFHDPEEVVAVAKLLSQELGIEVPVGFTTFVFKAQQGVGCWDERQWTYIRKDGKRVPVRLNVTGLYDIENNLYGFMGIAKDISQELVLHEQLELERIKSLRNAKLASLGEMSAGVAHEINNPLAIISSTIELLPKFFNNPEKFASKVETIKKSCERIVRIIAGLKKFSRINEKREFKSHDLGKIISEVLLMIEANAKRNMTSVTFNSNNCEFVLCDEIEIEQVFINLINNAIDAVKDRQERWVKIGLFSDRESIVVRVEDSGPGIPEHIRAKMFEPFFTSKKVGEGTGLGLSISKGILDEHNASIEILVDCSNTCFEIRFPRPLQVKNVA